MCVCVCLGVTVHQSPRKVLSDDFFCGSSGLIVMPHYNTCSCSNSVCVSLSVGVLVCVCVCVCVCFHGIHASVCIFIRWIVMGQMVELYSASGLSSHARL